MVNMSEKNWIFWINDWQAQVIMDSMQHVTLKMNHVNLQQEAFVTIVYAKCITIERLELWDSIAQVTLNIQGPWIVGGDFYVILKADEKLGGLPVHLSKTIDFDHFVNNCGLMELKSGSRYTWWNGRTEEDCIFKRLDRVFGNQEFINLSPSSEVSHLIRHGSKYAPLHVMCDTQEEVVVKPFKFLNFWSQHPKFLELVQDNWCLDFAANPFSEFQAKMKKVKLALAKCSKDTYGNIFQQISTIEDIIKVKELQFELNPSMLNRTDLHKAQAELNNYLHLEEEYWKQKSGMRWFKDGDRNTKEEAVTFYHDQFREQATSTDDEMLKKISALISTEQNESFISLPSNEELKLEVYGLNGDSTSGPDGFSGHFFQRIVTVLPGIISNTQNGFVKGRSIVENVLLAQEIIKDVNKRNNLHNVVVKLDMAKAYDRVSWIFLTKVLRQFGFSEVIVDMVWRLVLTIADSVTLKKRIKILRDYEITSGQLVNNDKSSFNVHEKVPAAVATAFGRRYILIAHVLQKMLVYLLSAMNPLKGVINQLHKIFAKFFWSNTAGVKGKHWVAWDKICFSKV
ncbi:uncharacterized protein LOC132628652 [Lycium barbarum]|uniref:uncharacterized protein LOC132628652 n=1 Tax=Lycium barbarum TaxID=112863 RepID=UPI00293EAF9D|nr:uncharacterized protein LOC132628652 [Lycium barbarum]